MGGQIAAQRQFAPSADGLPATPDYTESTAFADIDGDGDLDLVVGNVGYGLAGEQNRLYLNDGRGVFTDVTASHLPALLDPTSAVAFGDLDGDGDEDLVVGNGGYGVTSQNRIYRNDGRGVFTDVTAMQLPSASDSTESVALGDVDGDGDLDIVTGNSGYGAVAQNRIYRNDGSGRFTDVTASALPVDSDFTTEVALGDVDGDGDLDLALANFEYYTGQNRLYLNDGSGSFSDVTAAQLPADRDYTMAVAVGDVDGDGDLDLVFGNGWGQQDRVYLNDGAGRFTDVSVTALPPGGAATCSLALGDVDGDGDLDLLAATTAFATIFCVRDYLLLNDGAGAFTFVSRLPNSQRCSTAVALGDVDGDGDLDAVWGVPRVGGSPGAGLGAAIDVNLLRHLDTPAAPRLGEPFGFDVYARYGVSSPNDLALISLSTAPASIPLGPLGTLGIDPAQSLSFPALAIPQPAGTSSASLTVPNDPSLVGQAIYSQALVVSPPNGLRLTNVVRDVIR